MSEKKAEAGTEAKDPADEIRVRTSDLPEPSDEGQETAAPEEGAQTTSDSEPDDPEKKPSSPRRDRRMRTLRRQLAAADRNQAEMREKIEALEAQIQAQQSASAPKPDRGQYDSDEAWAEALVAWKAAQTPKPKPRPDREKVPPPPEVLWTPEEQQEFLETGKKAHGDAFDEAMAKARRNEWDAPTGVARYLMSSKQGAELAIYLSQHPGEARDIAEMAVTPGGMDDARAELDELAEKLRTQKKKPAPKTKAPAPTPTPDPGSPSSGNRFDYHRDQEVLTHRDLDEYMRTMKERDLRLAGRLK